MLENDEELDKRKAYFLFINHTIVLILIQISFGFFHKISIFDKNITSILAQAPCLMCDMFAGTHDFFGLNHYTTQLVSYEDQGHTERDYEKDQDLVTSLDPSWPG